MLTNITLLRLAAFIFGPAIGMYALILIIAFACRIKKKDLRLVRFRKPDMSLTPNKEAV